MKNKYKNPVIWDNPGSLIVNWFNKNVVPRDIKGDEVIFKLNKTIIKCLIKDCIKAQNIFNKATWENKGTSESEFIDSNGGYWLSTRSIKFIDSESKQKVNKLFSFEPDPQNDFAKDDFDFAKIIDNMLEEWQELLERNKQLKNSIVVFKTYL